jgi:4-amino-4-deoxy-L-arabinose transferase-like glycosyltransferase
VGFVDIYRFLDYKLLDTTADYMQSFNWIYQPFNIIEGIIWLLYIPKTIKKYWGHSDRSIVMWQCISFLLFGMSDFIEIYSTSVFLILFKLSILIALIVGHKAILKSINNAAQ